MLLISKHAGAPRFGVHRSKPYITPVDECHIVTMVVGEDVMRQKATDTSTSPSVYSCRYLDRNRYTFEYHAVREQDDGALDYNSGIRVSNEIT